MWVNITVVLGLLAMLAWTVFVIGPEGYPFSVVLGGLLGAYGGLDQYLKQRRADKERGAPPPRDGDP